IISGGALQLGANTGAAGFYELSNGTANVSAAGGVIVGSLGVGTFKHSGGVHIISNGALKLGDGVAAAGNYELSGGSVTAGAGGVLVGRLGMGTFIHSGGVHIVTTLGSALRLGADSGGSGFYQLSETGSLTATFENIGDNGTGNFQQIGGMNVVNGSLMVAANPGSQGNYSISSGSLLAKQPLVNSNGPLNYDGGSLNAFAFAPS